MMRLLFRTVAALAALAFALVAYMYLTLPDVRALATENPATTAFMELRASEAARDGRTLRHLHRWLVFPRISANLKRAVLVAEDSAFYQHEGVDVEQVREALKAGMRGRPIRGASTITQQLAKNLYLSPSRDPLRKVRELIIARRLEASLSKARIFELYLNLIEWGDGIWGADAAARAYFGVPAASLTPQQAALMAGAIINPRRLTINRPTRRLLRRQQIILSRMGGSAAPNARAELDALGDEAEEAAVAPPPAAVPAVAPGSPEAAAEPVVDAPSVAPAADAAAAPAGTP